jgi:RNA polymerase sigma-70 factor, ECF subfamily
MFLVAYATFGPYRCVLDVTGGGTQLDQDNIDNKAALPVIRTDAQILQDWMDLYGDVVLRTATLLLRDGHLAEDVSQEVFLLAYQKQHQLVDKSKVRSWLLRITVNLCHSHRRSSAWKRLMFTDWLEGLRGFIEHSVPGPEETVPLHISVVDLIDQLSYADREVLVLFYYHSLSLDDISHVLNEPLGTVKSRLSRARGRAKRIWERSERDG